MGPPFLYGYSEKLPHLVAFYDSWGYGGHIRKYFYDLEITAISTVEKYVYNCCKKKTYNKNIASVNSDQEVCLPGIEVLELRAGVTSS